MGGTPCFPMFVPLEGKTAAVIGGGVIGTRRVRTLLKFGCRIVVIAPEVTQELETLAQSGQICWERRDCCPMDLAGVSLAVAATDSRAVNHEVYLQCRERGIPASIADCREECSFYFPAVVKSGEIAIGIGGTGTDHKRVRKIADRLREMKEQGLFD